MTMTYNEKIKEIAKEAREFIYNELTKDGKNTIIIIPDPENNPFEITAFDKFEGYAYTTYARIITSISVVDEDGRHLDYGCDISCHTCARIADYVKEKLKK